MIYQLKAKILRNKKVKGNCFHCEIKAPAISRASLPGQFVQIKVGDSSGSGIFLRRPFSVHGACADKLKLFYAVVGPGSELLSRQKSGDYLDLIGPLGSGFDYASGAGGRGLSVLIAGGMGVAPLLFLAEKLRGKNNLVLIGARTKSQVFCEKEFRSLGCAVKITTDDGSRGFKGQVTELLKRAISHKPSAIYACGPRLMLQEVARVSQGCAIPAQISLEEHLACGFGACLGCAVKTTRGYRRVCKDGPVFNADEISWGNQTKPGGGYA